MDRREFVGHVVAGTAALAGAAASGCTRFGKVKKSAIDQVALGRTGITVSRLGFGTGTRGWEKQSDQTRMGKAEFIDLLRYAYDCGITYFDCADIYGSHTYMREAMKSIPREKIVITSKVWWRDSEGVEKDFDRARRELGTDYIDNYLLHCLSNPDWPDELAHEMEFLDKAKQSGWIRAHGVSVHSLPALRTAAEHPWVDVCLARINHVGSHMDGKPDQVVPVLEKMHSKDKGVLGIKIAGEGDITDQLDESLRFVLGLNCVDAIIVGVVSREELDDTIGRLNDILAS